MPTSKVIYSGELRTNATHLASGETVITDAPVDNHGKGQAFSPTDTAATSLATCMLTVLGIYAENHGIDMKESNAEVSKIMNTEGPRRIVKIIVELEICTSEEMDEHQRTALTRVARTCPVALSLHPDIEQDIRIKFRKR